MTLILNLCIEPEGIKILHKSAGPGFSVMKINAIQRAEQQNNIYLHTRALTGRDGQCLVSINLIANVQND